jgi:hypothetical protein
VTTGIAIAAIVIGVVNAEQLQGELLRDDHDALVAQGQDIAVAYLARVESESHGLLRMIVARVRKPSYVQISDLDPSTSDDGALLTAGASADTLANLQNFYGQVFNLYQARFQRDGALTSILGRGRRGGVGAGGARFCPCFWRFGEPRRA